jgi:hypothetical protein
MRTLMLATLALGSLVTVGCKKEGAASDKPAAAAATGCAADATKSVEGGFCFSVPAALKPNPPYDKDSTSRRFDYSDGAEKSIAVVVETVEDGAWESHVTSLADQAKESGHKNQIAQDLPEGKFASWVEASGTTWATGMVHKGNKIITCRADSKTAEAALIDACKSIRAL